MKIRVLFEDGSTSIVLEGDDSEASTSLDSSTDSSQGGDSSDSSVGASASSVAGEDLSMAATESIGDRPFLTTPFDDYDVTEGLLLVAVVLLVVGLIVAVFKGR